MKSLTSEINKSYFNQGNCYICQEEFGSDNDKNYCKVEDHWINYNKGRSIGYFLEVDV